MVKTAAYGSCRGPRSGSQHLHCDSQLLATPVSGDTAPSCGLFRHWHIYLMCINSPRHTHTNKSNKQIFKKRTPLNFVTLLILTGSLDLGHNLLLQFQLRGSPLNLVGNSVFVGGWVDWLVRFLPQS